jgi:hypothetical protein
MYMCLCNAVRGKAVLYCTAALLICLLSSPPPTILHSHTPAIAAIVYSSIRARLSAVPLRGPPWSAVVRRPPWPAARRVLPCMYINMLRYALAVLCPRARRAYGAASIRMGIAGT